VVGPFFTVSRLQGSFDQSQEAIIADVFLKDGQQDVVIDILETTLDVSFNEPFRPFPNVVYFG